MESEFGLSLLISNCSTKIIRERFCFQSERKIIWREKSAYMAISLSSPSSIKEAQRGVTSSQKRVARDKSAVQGMDYLLSQQFNSWSVNHP